MDYHELCKWRVRVALEETGRDLEAEAKEAYPGHDYFNVQLPFALALSTEVLSDRYDAVVVDEGQDFREDFWLPIEMLLRDPGESMLYVFFDQNQAVYTRVATFPIKDDPFVLTVNCRNTKFIHEAAYHFFRGDQTDPPGIEGVPIAVLDAPSVRSQASRIQALVTGLLTRERVSSNDIVVLVTGQSKSSYYELLDGLPLPFGVGWSIEIHRQPNSILVDTINRFKGLEASIVILWGVDELVPARDRETLYVALSRPKSRLYVVGTAACDRFLQSVV